MTIDVGESFYPRLVNRNGRQGDGTHSAVDFRNRFLTMLDNPEIWKTPGVAITLDFGKVRKIGPSFANEAFGYFAKFAAPRVFFEKVRFVNCSEVQLEIIREEVESGR